MRMGCDQSKGAIDQKPRCPSAIQSVSRGPVVSLKGCPEERLKVRRLTDYQVDIIHSTWPLLSSDITATGTSVFTDIFANEPAVKKLFPYMSNMSSEDIITDPRFLDHATKFMTTLQSICDMLPDLDPQAPISQSMMLLGARHATIPGFSIAYFGIFQKCLHLTWERFLHEEYTADVRDVWAIIFDFGMERIRDGYMLYHQERAHSNSDIIVAQ